MKSGKLFWGFFLLTVGALFLLTKYDIIGTGFGFVWDLWPLIFVFWGALVIFKESFVRPVISALFGIFIAMLLFGIVDNGIGSIDFSEVPGTYTEYYTEDFDGAIKTADMEINSGAGLFIIKNVSDKLVEGKAKGGLAEYDFETWKDEENANVKFNLHKRNFNFFKGRMKNQLEISLNPNPVWSLRFNIGASKSNFDLSEYKVRDVELHTGAATSRMKLGDKNDSTDVHIEMGAATVNVEVPSGSGCSINSDMALSSREFPGFTKKSEGNYETENFESSKKKIFVHVNGGLATIKVSRY